MSHYTFYMDEILNKNFLFQEEEKKVKEESLFSRDYLDLNSLRYISNIGLNSVIEVNAG